MDCDHFLCQECQKAHGRMTLMKSHKIYTLAQLRSGEIVYKSKLREEVPKCGKHPDQNLNVYCDTCEQVICLACTVLHHGNQKHSLIGLSEAFGKCKKKVEELVSKVSKSKTELNTTIEKTCTTRKKLDNVFANTKKKISEKADQEVAVIRQEEQKLLKETDRIYKERVTMFEAAQANNSKEVTQTEHKLEEVKQLMNQRARMTSSLF
ncbi:E3 ubiquitin-protein ligase TRIM71-like [Patiria miniata]|uniref:B box-type domain-containing protein n=1 Tax=Patiria miniata TaxID=46514 RepID=A0A913ZUC3_PATMI|nr:E3 ubiquitin-protein ligase TRIM71-like [Patiria miniata]